MKCNSNAKDDFETMPLIEFWVKYVRLYQNVGDVGLRTLIPFSSIYLCEVGFSTLVCGKTKTRNQLNWESDLQCNWETC